MFSGKPRDCQHKIMKISVVIPVFNDAKAIFELVARLFAVADSELWDAEIIMVDDGSANDVLGELERVKASFLGRSLKIFRLEENEGQHRASLFGIMHCDHDVIVTMDSDLQHPPEEVPRLVKSLREGDFDLVYGAASSGHSRIRRFAGYVFFRVSNFSRPCAVRGSAFRAMTSSTADRLVKELGSSFLFIDAVVREMDLSILRVETEHHERKYGKSSYSMATLFSMAMRVFWFYLLPKVRGDKKNQ